MDCSKTINYLTERKRFCEYVDDCSTCPLSNKNNSTGLTCVHFQFDCPEKAIDIVQKWSDEHPQKTYRDDFLEKFPNTTKLHDGRPTTCRNIIYGLGECKSHYLCRACWNELMPEEMEGDNNDR